MNVSCIRIVPNAGRNNMLPLETIDFTRVSKQSYVLWFQHREDFCNRFYLDDFYHLL